MLVVREEQAVGEPSIRLKCPRRLVQELNIPEKGFVAVHMKKHRFEARHDVSGSSFRINVGAGFAPLLLDEGEL